MKLHLAYFFSWRKFSWKSFTYLLTIPVLIFLSAVNATAAPGDESLTLTGISTLDSDLDNDSDPNEVDQGGTAEWLLEYENTSGNFLPDAQINNVLTSGQEYIVGSAKAPPGWAIEYSTDNGSTYAASEPANGVTDIRFSNKLVAPEAGGTLTELPEPFQAVNQGTGGDGWVPILAGDRIYAIFHHQTFRLSCIDRATNTVCPGYPQYVTQQVNNVTQYFYADNVPGGGVFFNNHVYMMGYRNDGVFGLLCWDSTTDSLCAIGGFTEMMTNFSSTGFPRAWGPQAIGSEIYLVTDNHQMHCFDVSTNSLCPGYPKNNALAGSAAGSGDAGGLIDMETDPSTGRIYGVYKGYLHCFDTNTDAPCADWSGPVFTNNSNHVGLFFRKDTNGVRNGICVRPWLGNSSSTFTCYDLDGTNPSALPPALNCGYGSGVDYCGYYQSHGDTEAGSKIIFSSWHNPNGSFGGSAFCWDWTTNTPCQGTGYTNGFVNHYVNTGQITYEYGAVSDGTCVYNLGDKGLLHTFDPVTGEAPCAAVDSTTTPSLRVTPAEFTCDGDVPNFTWNELEVLDADMTSSVHFTSFQVTILDANDNVVLGPVEMVGGNGILDLSGISNSTSTIKAQINPTPVNGNPAWQNGNNPKVSITYVGDPIQFCFQTTPIVDCQGPATTAVDSTAAVSGLVVSDSLNVYPAAECEPQIATITIIKDADLDSETEFPFTSDIDGGDQFWLIDDGTGTQDSASFEVAAGTYTVTEGDPLGDWTLAISCDTDSGIHIDLAQRQVAITVAGGDDVTCTFENTAAPATIIITKETAGYSDETGFEFTGDLGDFELRSGETISFTELTPLQTYEIQEIIPTGWAFKYIDCDSDNGSYAAPAGIQVTPWPGEVVSCTITNEAVMGKITIRKEVEWRTSSDLDAFDLPDVEFDFDGDLPDFDLGDGDSVTFEVPVGVYKVIEDVPANWQLRDVSCDSEVSDKSKGVGINLQPEQEITCTFTNTPQCNDPKADLYGIISDEGTMGWVTNHSTALCTWEVGMASYEKYDPIVDNQVPFDYLDGVPVPPGETVKLSVELPECAVQVDLFYGPFLPSLAGQRYGHRLLDYLHLPGTGYCNHIPEPSSVSGYVTVNGAGLAAVTVTLTNVQADGFTQQTVTNEDGYYSFEQIPAGSYKLGLSGAALSNVMLSTSYALIDVTTTAPTTVDFAGQPSTPTAVTMSAIGSAGSASASLALLLVAMLLMAATMVVWPRRDTV